MPAALAIVLVDDHSEDGTRAIAERLTATLRERSRSSERRRCRPAGQASSRRSSRACAAPASAGPTARYLLLTDADIAHAPANLARLVAKAEALRLDLVSLMVRLRCQSFWERLLVPAFVFFFQMLYPFPAVNRAGQRTAAAAGGCMLVRRQALAQAAGPRRSGDS